MTVTTPATRAPRSGRHRGSVTALPTREPPNDVEAEQSLISAMLLSPGARSDARAASMAGSHFYKPLHGEFLNAMYALEDRGDAVDAVTVAGELASRGVLTETGNPIDRRFVLEVQAAGSSSGNASTYARRIRELAQFREQIALGTGVSESAYDERTDVEAIRRLGELAAGARRGYPSQSAELVAIARERFRFVHSSEGECYAVPRGESDTGGGVVVRFKGEAHGLRQSLGLLFETARGRPPSQQAQKDALDILLGEAQQLPKEAIGLRVAAHDDDVWVDLGCTPHRFVRIGRGEWSVEDHTPALFERTALTGALPEPVRGGDIAKLWEFVNVPERDRDLLVAWLVSALLPNFPHPVLFLRGEQGTAKSTTAKVFSMLFDPTGAQLRSLPKDAHDWGVVARGSWGVPIDNISRLPGWGSDSICRAVTGDSDVTRELFGNRDLAILAFRRIVILTGIDVAGIKPDLAERTLLVHLDPITAGGRRTDEDVEAAFVEAWPALLGALLELAAQVRAEMPRIERARAGELDGSGAYRNLGELPRMADFALTVAALDELRSAGALERYRDVLGEFNDEAIDSSLVAQRLLDWLEIEDERPSSLRTTVGELWKQLTPDRQPRGWPANPKAMSHELRRVQPALRSRGVTVTFLGHTRTGSGVEIVFDPRRAERGTGDGRDGYSPPISRSPESAGPTRSGGRDGHTPPFSDGVTQRIGGSQPSHRHTVTPTVTPSQDESPGQDGCCDGVTVVTVNPPSSPVGGVRAPTVTPHPATERERAVLARVTELGTVDPAGLEALTARMASTWPDALAYDDEQLNELERWLVDAERAESTADHRPGPARGARGSETRGRRRPGAPTPRALPAAPLVLEPGALVRSDGTRVPVAATDHVDELAAAAREADADLVIVHTSALEWLGLPAELPDPAEHSFVDPALATPGTRITPGGLAWQITARGPARGDSAVRFLFLSYDMSSYAGPWHELTVAELVDGLERFRTTVGYPWRGSVGLTGEELVTSTHPIELGGVILRAVDAPDPARDGGLEQPQRWKRELVDDELGAGFVHAYDARSQYLAAWGVVELGIGAPAHHDGPLSFDAKRDKDRPGLWRLASPLPAHVDDGRRLPVPWSTSREWVTTETLVRAHELHVDMPTIVESWVWVDHARYMRGAYERLRDARAALLAAGPDDVSARAALDAVKAVYRVGTGRLSMDRGTQKAWGKRWYHPDWGHAIRAKARVNLDRRLRKLAADPFAIATDGLYFASDEPDPVVFAESIGLPLGVGLGQFSYEHTVALTDELRVAITEAASDSAVAQVVKAASDKGAR